MATWCIKNPPQKRGRYLVTIEFMGSRQVMQADRTEYPKGNWYWYILPSGSRDNIIAWQKCPEPYKG